MIEIASLDERVMVWTATVSQPGRRGVHYARLILRQVSEGLYNIVAYAADARGEVEQSSTYISADSVEAAAEEYCRLWL